MSRDPELDREYDGAPLCDLLVYDEQRRGERLTNYKLHTFTPSQRDAVDAFRAHYVRDERDCSQWVRIKEVEPTL